MEFLTLLLSSLIGILSPAGVVVDQVVESSLRDQFEQVERLDVRIESVPSYRLLQGKVDQVQLAGRGLYLVEDVRIDTLEVETDAIALDPAQLRQGVIQLEQPLQAGIRLVLDQDDIDRTLQSPKVVELLQNLSFQFAGLGAVGDLSDYTFSAPKLTLIAGDRMRFEVTLQQQDIAQSIVIVAESGFQVLNGTQIQLIDPVASVNQQPIPVELIGFLQQSASQFLDLRRLEELGITARLLQLEVEPNDQLAIAAFVRIEPSFLSGN